MVTKTYLILLRERISDNTIVNCRVKSTIAGADPNNTHIQIRHEIYSQKYSTKYTPTQINTTRDILPQRCGTRHTYTEVRHEGVQVDVVRSEHLQLLQAARGFCACASPALTQRTARAHEPAHCHHCNITSIHLAGYH